ncbi:MAG: hypothetical protein HY047_17775 [Acidobacteria bacterium]|nr:hypothetical protein [Acidobacteriota bacterium]
MLEAKGVINLGNPAKENIHYNCGEFMQSLIGFGVRLLEALFALGLAGSTMVLLITLKEDLEIMLGRSSDIEH